MRTRSADDSYRPSPTDAQRSPSAPPVVSRHSPAADTRSTRTAAPGPQRHLVIDALNYLTFFFPVFEPAFRGRPPWSLYAEMQRRVRFFLEACALAHWVPHFVIDSGQQSDEVRAKWRMRREREVACGFRPMPYNADVLLATALRARDADVLQPERLDADDVVVRLALHWNAAILSGDRDMLRYTDLPHKRARIMELFAFAPSGALVLAPRRDFECRGTALQARAVALDLPAWRTPKCKSLRHLRAGDEFVRGNPDSLTRSHGNLHLLARGLRQALYERLGLCSVRETIPVWDADGEEVRWHSTEVSADGALDANLESPSAAYAWLLAQDRESARQRETPSGQDTTKWRSYTRAMLVGEYHVAAQDTAACDTVERIVRVAQSVDPYYVPTLACAHGWRPPVHYAETRCAHCGHNANCIHAELEHLWGKGLRLPTHCKTCRRQRAERVGRLGGRTQACAQGRRTVYAQKHA